MERLPERRALALAMPCARARDALAPEYRWLFRHRGRRWSAILTINR
jgi:hypothetical protein